MGLCICGAFCNQHNFSRRFLRTRSFCLSHSQAGRKWWKGDAMLSIMQSTCWQNSGSLERKRLFLMSATSGFLFTCKALIRQSGSWFAAGFSGVHFHCSTQRRKQCVGIRHLYSSRSLVTCPLKCHASGMSEVRLGNAAVTNGARFQCPQRTKLYFYLKPYVHCGPAAWALLIVGTQRPKQME